MAKSRVDFDEKALDELVLNMVNLDPTAKKAPVDKRALVQSIAEKAKARGGGLPPAAQ